MDDDPKLTMTLQLSGTGDQDKARRAVGSTCPVKANDSGPPAHILVVGEDPASRQAVITYLEENSLHAVPANGRQEIAQCFAESPPDLVLLLDNGLGPDRELDLLREVRRRSDVPVIITAGCRSDEIDRVIALELGADDCVTRPFGMRELLARIRAVLRGYGAGPVALRRGTAGGRYRFGGWELSLRTRRLVDPTGRAIALTKGEYALLTTFLAAPGRPLSRDHLTDAARMHDCVSDRSIDVRVLRLRRKLESDPTRPRIIRTKHGVGYVFTLPVKRL
jgi:two-component system, OmpR family, response regulator